MDKYTLVESVKDAAAYLIIPEYKVAIPQSDHCKETLVKFLVEKGDIKASQDTGDYPVVTSYHLRLHFAEYEILPVMKLVTHVKPKECFSGWEAMIRERQREIVADQEREARRQHRAKELARRTVGVEF